MTVVQPDDIRPDSEEAQYRSKKGTTMFTGEIVCSTVQTPAAHFSICGAIRGRPAGSQVPLNDFRPPPYQLSGADRFPWPFPSLTARC